MAKGIEDLQMLRLIRAFQKLTEPDTRRSCMLRSKFTTSKPVPCSSIRRLPSAPANSPPASAAARPEARSHWLAGMRSYGIFRVSEGKARCALHCLCLI
jgi:hypothetical protein